MRIDVLTLFPEMFSGPFEDSIIKRAVDKGIVDLNFVNFRDYSLDKHKKVDDYPFGGGAGMVLKVEPIYDAVEDLKKENKGPVLLMSPKGKPFTQKMARELAQEAGLIFLCGHYEGVDERVKELAVDEEVSIGDYVLTGGEIPAMVIMDAVIRLLPGAISDFSDVEESFENGLLEYPQYTRPREFKGLVVPEVLLNGDHEKIRLWRLKESLKKTLSVRKDLLQNRNYSEEELRILEEILSEGGK